MTESKEFKFLFLMRSLVHAFSLGDLIKNIATANWNINFCRNKLHIRINVVEIKFTVGTSIIPALCGTEQSFYMGTSKKEGRAGCEIGMYSSCTAANNDSRG